MAAVSRAGGRGGFEPAVQIAREDAAERQKETGDDK
jgi:hypothetical protein